MEKLINTLHPLERKVLPVLSKVTSLAEIAKETKLQEVEVWVMVGRILNHDPKLYADIEILNPETTKALKAYLKSAHQLYKIIKKKDTAKFIKYFKEAADYLGPFKKEAEEYSDYLIEKLVERKKK